MDSTADDDSASDEPAGTDDSTEQTANSHPAQPDALRRQQFLFAVVGSLLGGGALAVSLLQRYPNYGSIWILVGGLGSVLLFRLISGSIFPGESEDDGGDSEEADGSETELEDPDEESSDSGTPAE